MKNIDASKLKSPVSIIIDNAIYEIEEILINTYTLTGENKGGIPKDFIEDIKSSLVADYFLDFVINNQKKG